MKTRLSVAVAAAAGFGLAYLVFQPSSEDAPLTQLPEPAAPESSGAADDDIASSGSLPALSEDVTVLEQVPAETIAPERDATAGQQPPVAQIPSPVVLVPIPVHPSLQELLATDTVSQLHAAIESEPVDASWSPTMEGRLYSYFAGQPEITRYFGAPTVHCRATLCEIQVVANTDRRDWLQMNAQLFEQDWAADFGEGPVGHGIAMRIQDGRTVLVWYLRRGDATVQSVSTAASV